MKASVYNFHGSLLLEWLYIAILTIIFSSSSHGQELGPPKMDEATGVQGPIQTDDLQANGVNESIKPDKAAEQVLGNLLHCGPFDVHLNAEASLVYNDNIYLQQTHKIGDL